MSSRTAWRVTHYPPGDAPSRTYTILAASPLWTLR